MTTSTRADDWRWQRSDAEPSDVEFESEVRGFLDSHASRRTAETFVWGEGSDAVGLFAERTPAQERADLEVARAWAQAVFDAGLGWITGPPVYGGRGLPRRFQRIYDAAAADYRTPSLSVYGIGLGMVAPTILAHGTEPVKQAYLQPMHRGDIVACQLFSEPGAGSDLASLQSRAVRDGDEWVINGQKVWTSGAQLSDIGEIVCRTDPSLPKHRGLTAFVVDMHAPGVEVRPLAPDDRRSVLQRGLLHRRAGARDSHRLGDVNGGWTVALTTLMNERAAIGGGGGGAAPAAITRLIELCRAMGRADDPLVRQKLADVIIRNQVSRYSTVRSMAAVAVGQAPGPELSLAKMALTDAMMRTNELLSLVLGPALVADTGRWGTFAWSHYLLGVPGMRVAGGSDEVLRNIVGERVLGLPKEPKAAQELPA